MQDSCLGSFTSNKKKYFFMEKKTMLFVISLLIGSITFGQTSKREYKITDNETVVIPESKALKNFKRSHPDVTNESWSSTNGYFFVKFKEGDVYNKIVYTRDGRLDYALKMYRENSLPYTIRAVVKSAYYDYKIVDVQELQLKNKIIFLIKITDANTWKTIRVSNGDLEEIENYSTVISPCR